MKIKLFILLFFILNIFLKFSKSDILPDYEKSKIDQLITLYSLPVTQPVEDYCSFPQYFECNVYQNYTIIIFLDGLNIKPNPPSILFNFNFLNSLNIKNTILNDDFFYSLPTSLNNLTLSSTVLNTFPIDVKNLRYLYFYDIPFSGIIYSYTIKNLISLDIKFTLQENMKDYIFIDNLDKKNSFQSKNLNLYLNNLMNFSSTTFFTFNLYLGNNINIDSFNSNFSTLSGNELKIYPGFNNKPLYITDSPIQVTSLGFYNISFDSFSFLDFSNSRIIYLIFDSCNGLYNLSNDLNIIVPNSLISFQFTNSDLTKFPNLSFFKNCNFIYLSNNKLSGALPLLYEPNKQSESLSLDISNNQFTGQLPQNFCYHFVDFSNNLLSGNLLDCYVCSLKSIYVKPLVEGNSFSNYISGTTDPNQFPNCPGITLSGPVPIAPYSSLSVNCTNCGWIVSFPDGKPTIISNPSMLLGIDIPNKRISSSFLSSQTYNYILGNGSKIDFQFKLPDKNQSVSVITSNPLVQSVSIRTYFNVGYSFFFFGGGLPAASQGSSGGNISIDGMPCAITESGGNYVICLLPKPQLPEKNYTALVYNSITKLYGSFEFKFTRVSPWISALSTAPTNGGLITMWGSYGTGSYSNLTVEISQKSCDILSVDEFQLICNIGPGTGVQNVTLTLNGTEFFILNGFRYQDSIIECPNCGVYGQCDYVSGQCVCQAGFGGSECQQIFIKDPIIVKNETLVQIIKDDYSFGFSLKSIKEYDINQNIVKVFPLDNDNWSLDPFSTQQKWTYIQKTNDGTVISYTVEQVIGSPKNFTFAGQSFTLQPGSIKLSTSILNWNYLGSLNTLKLEIESKGQANQNGDCDGTSIGKNSDGTSINYLTIQKGSNVLYGRFIDKVVSDNRTTFSSVSIEKQTKDSIIVSISLPYCKECLLDPDFSVLISNNVCSGKTSSWVIPTAVVISVVGFIVLALGLYVVLKDRIYISFKKGGKFGIVFFIKNSKSSSATSTTMSSSDY